jgi:pimeloyl-ACP methyl ester carboxylesterase
MFFTNVIILVSLVGLLSWQGPQFTSLVSDATIGPRQCDFNEIRVSPDGRHIAVWKDEHLAQTRSFQTSKQSQILLIGQKRTVQALSVNGDISALHWTAVSNEMEMLVDGVRRITIDAGGRQTSSLYTAPEWRYVNIKNNRWAGLSQALASRKLLQQSTHDTDSKRLFQTALVGQGTTLLYVTTDNYTLARRPAGPLPTHVTPFDISHASLAGSDDGTIDYEGKEGPFRRVILDPGTGATIGSQFPNRLIWDVRNRPRSGRATPQSGMFKDAEVVGDVAYALGADPTGEHWIERHGSGSVERIALCKELSGQGWRTTSKVVELAHAENSVSALWHRNSNVRRHPTLVVRFHGGPFASVMDNYPSPALRRLTLPELDVIEIDYAGSRMSGRKVAPRITPATIKASNDELVRWARRRGYHDIVPLGESLGAMPALDLAARYTDIARRLILLAPLSRIDVDRSVAGQLLSSSRLQSHVERAAFGDTRMRAKLALWLDRTVNLACRRSKIMSFTGSTDVVTPIHHMSPCLAKKTTVLPNVTHHGITHDDAVWTDILAQYGPGHVSGTAFNRPSR